MRPLVACHPDREHYAKKKCRSCYDKYCYRAKPAARRRAQEYRVQKTYGLALEEVEAMAASQDHRCAICNEKKRLHIDHDHETGRVRGLLCVHCNSGLGQFADSPKMMFLGIRYLEGQAWLN